MFFGNTELKEKTMPQDDFIGTWTVSRTSGTPFGIGAEFDIEKVDDKLKADLNGQALTISYEEITNVVTIDGIEGMESLMLAVYKDPSTGYRAIYGGGLSISRNAQERLVTCAAETDSIALPPDEFQANSEVTSQWFNVSTTSGTQFGVGSTVELQPNPSNPSGLLLIRNALGQPALELEIQPVARAETTFKGTHPDAVVEGGSETVSLSVQFSLIQLDETGPTRIFGIQVVDDPENSGVWGGDEEDPPGGQSYS